MIVDCIGCLHGARPHLEGGDLLIVTGDLCARDEYDEYVAFFEWLKKQKYRKKIFISGNHDNNAMSQFDWGNKSTDYLLDSGTVFQGLKIWGSPWTNKFDGINPKCCAFTVEKDDELMEKWNLIPRNIDIIS